MVLDIYKDIATSRQAEELLVSRIGENTMVVPFSTMFAFISMGNGAILHRIDDHEMVEYFLPYRGANPAYLLLILDVCISTPTTPKIGDHNEFI